MRGLFTAGGRSTARLSRWDRRIPLSLCIGAVSVTGQPGLGEASRVAGMNVAQVGLALSIGAGIALLGGPHTGTLIDRIGPGKMAALSCLLRTGAFLAYLGIDQFWQIIAISAVVIWSDNAFWPSDSAMIIALCGREQRARWYALGRTVRSVGMGLGAALSGVIVASGSDGARMVVLFTTANEKR